MQEWFVYQPNGNHIGPISTRSLARSVARGTVPRTAHVGAKGDARWQPLTTAAPIAAALTAISDADETRRNSTIRPSMASIPPVPEASAPKLTPPPPAVGRGSMASMPSLTRIHAAPVFVPSTAPETPVAAIDPKPEEQKLPPPPIAHVPSYPVAPAPPLPGAPRLQTPAAILGAAVLLALLLFAVAWIVKPGEAPAAADPGEVAVATNPARPKMHVGIALTGLSKFELGPGTYNAELIVTVRCDAEPCNPDLDTPNGRVTGKETLHDEKLLKIVKLKAELTGFVDLSEFPFDEHILQIVLEDKSDPEGAAFELDREALRIDPDVRLAGWQVTRGAASIEREKVAGDQSISQVHFGVAVKRPSVSAFFKTLVPVFFMAFVAFLTLLLKPKSAAGRLTAATGGLMSVVLFHLSATSSLPPIGHLTRMDKFMIATYLVYVLNIALSVAMVRLEEKKKEKAADMTYLVAAGLVPGVALVAWATVFLRFV